MSLSRSVAAASSMAWISLWFSTSMRRLLDFGALARAATACPSAYAHERKTLVERR